MRRALTFSFFTVAPTVKLDKSSKHLHLGQSTSVTCSVTGDPRPTITWYKITANGGREKKEQGKGELVFRQVTKEDEGTYQCEATNIVKSAKTDYKLIVTGMYLPRGKNIRVGYLVENSK